MTSDAKIGLLLGLIFIFVIAFIINGIPRGNNEANNSELTTNMIGPQTGPPGLGAKERKVQTAFNQVETAEQQAALPQSLPEADPQTRFTMPLPQGPSAYQQIAIAQPSRPDGVQSPVVIATATQPASGGQITPAVSLSPVPAQTGRIYTVGDGDSLSSIAKRIYGAEAGNKLENLERIFEANKGMMKSIDELHVGQKLLIPPLPASAGTPAVLTGPHFEKVDAIGKKPSPAPQAASQQSKPAVGRAYIVRDGDTLWKIAAEQLGDGNRYKEIAKMNSDVLANEDALDVGLHLKLPAK